MALLEFLSPEAVAPSLKVNSKKQLLHDLSAHAGRLTGLDERAVFESLLQRERLGSTGIGEGIAIPHGKPARLGRLFGLMARLEKPVDFEAIDRQPVDLVFALFAPEAAGAEHLKALARVSRTLRSETVCANLRSTFDPSALYAILTESRSEKAA